MKNCIDEIVGILAQSPLALTLRLANAPKKLCIGFEQGQYIIGPNGQGALGYVYDRIVNQKPRYVISSIMSGMISQQSFPSHVEVGIIDILFADNKEMERGVFLSLHQRMITLPEHICYEDIESQRFIEKINAYAPTSE